MIPQNTTVVTKDMIKQFDVEHIEMQNEFERYNSWFNPIQFQLIGAIGKLKLLTKKKWFKFSPVVSITNLFGSL